MRRSLSIILGMVLTTGSWWLPSVAASFYVGVIHPAATPATRSSASRMSAKSNANASDAVGNPYVNPNVTAGHRTTQDNASANAEAAEIRSAHVDVGPH